MTETACITVNHLSIIVFLSTMFGFMVSTLVLKYYFARRRARKMSPAQADLTRLAEYLIEKHPDYVQAEGQMVDSVIRLIDVLHNQKAAL